MENKSKTNTVLLVITIILLVVGLVYLFLNKSKTVPENISVNNPQQENQNNQTSDNTSLLTYNYPEKYNVTYPKNWIIAHDSKSENSSVFFIKNSEGAIPNGANSQMRSTDSFIDIQLANYEIDPLVHKTIDDVLKDPKFGVSKTNRINNVVDMNIGGKNLRVELLNTDQSKGYSFLYNGNVYHINLGSGSKEQYQKDKGVFDNMIQSFKLLNSEESTSDTFNHQPGAIKSIVANKDKDGFENGSWTLSVDLLTDNPNWLPGNDSSGSFFLNQNSKLRNLKLNYQTVIKNCKSQMPDYYSGFENNPLSFVNYVQNIINRIKTGEISGIEYGYTAYFDIDGTNITSIYEQCLP